MFKPEELGRENSNEKFNALQRSMTLSPWDGRLTRELQFVRQLRERFPQADVRDSSPIVWNLRKYKSPAELAIMRQAARIGVQAHNALIASTRPGIAERALAAVFEFVCKKDGARDLAYDTIIMSGKNHAYGHYHQYDRVLNDGDFVILDARPTTRTPRRHSTVSRIREFFPAEGALQAALGVHDVCIQHYRPA
jgi:Xaa-Pro aminopeptidase